MISLLKEQEFLLSLTSTEIIRDLYFEISWESRLIGIVGARGVGKTTMLLQRIKLAFEDISKVIYATLDHIYFANHSILDLAQKAREEGISHLFLDEIHKYRGWQREIKNIYDLYPDINIVFTGSALLQIDNSIVDLSRRCLKYILYGLSFREYLWFKGLKFPKIELSKILYDHIHQENQIISEIEVLKHFNQYLKTGYYPFFKREKELNCLMRVNGIINAVIENDIPAVENVEYSTLVKTKQFLAIVASQSPSTLNVSQTAELMDLPKNQLMKILYLLERAQILRLLFFKNDRNPKSLAKPKKLLLNNTTLIYALGEPDKGKIRETFLASMTGVKHKITYPQKGDLLIDGRYLVEVGGKGKKFDQIKDIPDSFIAADDTETGFGNKIPLWLFGFLY